MKKNFLITFGAIIVFILSLLSCAPLDNADGLKTTIASSTAIIIPAGTDSSCESINSGTSDSSIAAPYINIPAVTITWSRSQALNVTSIKIKLFSTSLSTNPTEKFFSGTELMNTWVTGYNTTYPLAVTGPPSYNAGDCKEYKTDPVGNATPPCLPAGIQITSSTSAAGSLANKIYRTNNCPFKIGGIAFTNPRNATTGYIEATVNGYYNAGGGEVKTVSFKNYLNFTYGGSQ